MRRFLGLVAVVVAAFCALGPLAGSAAADPPTAISLALSAPTVIADGTSQVTATATVTGDVTGTEPVTITSNKPDETVTAVTPGLTLGQYQATITSSTALETATITATDTNIVDTTARSATQQLQQVAGPVANVSLSVPATPVKAGVGSTATVTVEDAHAHRLDNQTVNVSAPAAVQVGTVAALGNGQYSATLTSTTPGSYTISASDGAVSAATQTLNITPADASHVTVQATPASIAADGTSTSAVTATVTDAFGNPRVADGSAISFTPAGRFGTVTNNGNGTYTATYTSTTTPGKVTVKATDGAASGTATINQAEFASSVSLMVIPATTATNLPVGFFATVSTTNSAPAPVGAVTFENGGIPIPGCINEPINGPPASATCQTTFGAVSSPVHVTAEFVSSASNVADSGAATNVTVGRSPTTTALDVSNPSVAVGSAATYVASITPGLAGTFGPTGTVMFLDRGTPISACQSRPLAAALGVWMASCTVKYASPGSHGITARYTGDGNFSGSGSSSVTITVHSVPPPILGTIRATMQWTFFFTPSYTSVRALLINGAPIGATVTTNCRGKGCGFSTRKNTVRKPTPCKKGAKRCHSPRAGVVNLLSALRNRHLRPGTTVEVRITRTQWIGKDYRFTMRKGRGPLISISCLAPGSTKPGVGC